MFLFFFFFELNDTFAMALLCTFVSIQMRFALQSANDKNHCFCQNWQLKKLLVIADLSTYQVTLGRQQLSCELRPPLSGKVPLFSLWGVTAERKFEILSKFPLLVCELAQWHHCWPSAEVGEESPSHVVLIESKSHFMWLHGFVQALWRSQPSCLEMSVSCKAIRNHCWNTQAASTRLELWSGKHQRWVVVLILIPLSNMMLGTVKWCFDTP